MLEHTVQKVQQLLATASSAVVACQRLEAANLTVVAYKKAVVGGHPPTTGKKETGHEETHDPFLSHGLSSGDKGKGRCTEMLNACLAVGAD